MPEPWCSRCGGVLSAFQPWSSAILTCARCDSRPADREECARCGVVGPVDVACVGCALIVGGRDAMAGGRPRDVALVQRYLSPESRRGGLSRCRRLASVLAARLVLA